MHSGSGGTMVGQGCILLFALELFSQEFIHLFTAMIKSVYSAGVLFAVWEIMLQIESTAVQAVH